jgi:Fe-S cluster assembly protein SufD
MNAPHTEATAATDQFAELFESDRFRYPRTPARAAAHDALRQTGLPLRHDEAWSHTSLRDLIRCRYQLPAPLDAMTANDRELALQDIWTAWVGVDPVLTVDGESRDTAAADPDGAPRQSLVAQRFARGTETAFSRLNEMFSAPVGDVVERLAGAGSRWHYAHLSSNGVLAAPRRRLVIPAGATATVVETYQPSVGADASRPSLCVPHTEIVVGDDAQLELVRVQLEAESAFHIGSTTIVQGTGSEVRVTTADLGARLARHTLSVLVAGSARCHLAGVTVAGGEQVADLQTYVEHAEPGSSSRQLFKRVLTGDANAVFAGRIVVRDVAQQTDAFQLNNNLLLGSGTVVTMPQLEIAADDVRCSHGATVGQLDDDQMFYLRTRGIDTDRATTLLAAGFVSEALAPVADAEVRQQLTELVQSHLARHLKERDT